MNHVLLQFIIKREERTERSHTNYIKLILFRNNAISENNKVTVCMMSDLTDWRSAIGLGLDIIIYALRKSENNNYYSLCVFSIKI